MDKIDRNSQPLAEVFGFPVSDISQVTLRHRKNKLCPFNNRVPSCTKDKAKDPLGVCSIFHAGKLVITCPVRFRENWTIAEDASEFFFEGNNAWTSISEVNLNDANGKTAGHIDIVLVEYDNSGKIVDFGALEVQAVYISGNIRSPFESYISNQKANRYAGWKGKPNYPKPDYLSSSRKRLIPQILYKGGILKTWGKRQAVVLQKSFFETLPEMPRVKPETADIAWMLYDLKENSERSRFVLTREDVIYTKFEPALERFVEPEPGDIDEFVNLLQTRLDEHLEENPPDAPILTDEVLS